MTLPRRTRRLIDAAVAAAIAVAVAVVAVVLWLGSDIRATTSVTIPESAAPSTPVSPSTVPESVRQVWSLPVDPTYGAVASPYGSVVTATTHTVTGHDARDGATLWSYSRANRPLCAIGSGDTTTDKLSQWTGVHGIMTIYAKNGYCSQVTLLNPTTGERLYQRTSPGSKPGELFFGEPYVGWLGSDYLELWRHDLVATIRYGDQPNPVNADGPHLGCTFTDAAVTADQLATIEHCGSTTNLVLNWPTPGDSKIGKDKGWDQNHSSPKATIDLSSPDAVIVGITADRAAVIVDAPSPALVIYDAHGDEVSRSPVDVSAEEIRSTARHGITPSVTTQSRRYSLVGTHLVSMSTTAVTVTVPPSTTEPPTSAIPALTTTATTPEPTTEDVESPVLDWVADSAAGLPTRIGGSVLVPTADGLSVRSAIDGAVRRTIPVDRPAGTTRVGVSAVGPMLIENRGTTIVGLASSPD